MHMQLALRAKLVYPQPMPTEDDYRAFGRCYAYAAHRAERRMSALYDAALAPFGLTLRQFAVLAEAGFAPRLPVARLARRLVVDPTTLTRALKPLAARGLIALLADPNDARQRLVEATPKGLKVLDAANPAWRAAQAAVAAALGESHAEALSAALVDAERRLRTAKQG
jgi:DNA-binding MarR family transcriptional regulator